MFKITLLISKAFFIDLTIVLHLDLKIICLACQLLKLFTVENGSDAILDLQTMKFFRQSTLLRTPKFGNSWRPLHGFRQGPFLADEDA